MEILKWSILLLVAGVIVSELYKGRFESKQESKDERGHLLIYKSKALSYTILSYGITAGVILVAILEVLKPEYFVFFVMIVMFIQSIGSSIYLFNARKL
ncbi:hypothetical protein [Salinithrix halophila]|uniref:DUF3784 domain-containing protein n=1 Tax=Salinithrix halophila TaxID=1485204 RepID=A0ABV8JI54_9BACL